MSIVADPASTNDTPRPERRDRTAQLLGALAVTEDEAARADLLEELVCLNMPVARSVASRFFHRGVDADDLLQVAYAALTKAARDFDPRRHADFLAYAVPTIRGELKKHFRDRGWTVRPPRRVQETQIRIGRAESELQQQLGRSPRPSELAAHLDLDLEDVVEAMSADGCFTPASLDRTLAGIDGTGVGTIGDLLGQLDPGAAAAEARTALAPVVRNLKQRDQLILYLRFFEERTQQEIADQLGVTQMQVSRLLARILRDLRQGLGPTADARPSAAGCASARVASGQSGGS